MLRLDNLKFFYSQTPFCFNFQVKAGEFVAIVGPSGSGKSTLLNLIAGFVPPTGGKLYLADKHYPISSTPAQRPISMLFQEHNLFSHLTVVQNIALGLHPNLRLTATQWQQVEAMATAMGIAHKLQQLPQQLSGGQRQRVALARCLLRRQPILLLDEPFLMLDPAQRTVLMALLAQHCIARQFTILLVSHHLADIAHIAPRTLVVVNGEIVYDGATTTWLAEQGASSGGNAPLSVRGAACSECRRRY